MPNLAWVAIGLAIFVAGVSSGSWVTASIKNTVIARNELRYAVTTQEATSAAIATQQVYERRYQETLQQVTIQDTIYQQELANAKRASEERVAAITNGVKRLYVPTRCPALSDPVPGDTRAASTVDGAGYTELSRSLGAAISATGADADAIARQLNALQDYVHTIRHEVTP